MDYRLGRTLLSAADIQARVREMAGAISHDGQHYRHLPYLATLEPSRPG
jgi:hypoxanthine-guanine phosphoribosyltransferase